jgi:ubiquinone/menaquinone biosynthesis C-methylase UbiE
MLQRIAGLLRPAIVLLAVFLVIGFAGIAFQAIRTLQTLAAVEAQRDQWQRPADVIRALDLKDGSVIADLGSGAGYFTLKLSDVVGKKGKVIPVDLRRSSLLFLQIRAVLQSKHNIQSILGDTDDPHLPEGKVDAALVANTYHELTAPDAILRHLFQALRSGGRLVIVDRPVGDLQHNISAEAVEIDLRRAGFEITRRTDGFIRESDKDSWWLIVAVKP